MSERVTAALNESLLAEPSRRFGERLFSRCPDLKPFASMERFTEDDDWALVVSQPAPSGAPEVFLTVWMENGEEPSVEFGAWHTHEGCWLAAADEPEPFEAILNLIDGIRRDRFVVCEEVDARGGPCATILDLTVPDALVDELTSKYSQGEARIRSWSGSLDRCVSLKDLESLQQSELGVP